MLGQGLGSGFGLASRMRLNQGETSSHLRNERAIARGIFAVESLGHQMKDLPTKYQDDQHGHKQHDPKN